MKVNEEEVALYLLSSPNHNFIVVLFFKTLVALYLLSSPNHNSWEMSFKLQLVALYLLSSPNHNPVFLMCCNIIQLQGVYSTGNGMVSSLSMAKLLKKLKLNRLLLYFLFYLSPYIDDVGVLFVGYRDYTKSSLAGHEEFYPLDVYIP